MVNFNRNYDGLYVEQSITSSQCLRGYYKKGINCIWWHKEYRHWWIGDCNNRPENVGHAWLEPDVTCPNQAGSDWRKSGTDEELNGYVTIGIMMTWTFFRVVLYLTKVIQNFMVITLYLNNFFEIFCWKL